MNNIKVFLADPLSYTSDYNKHLYSALLNSCKIEIEYLESQNLYLLKDIECNDDFFFLKLTKKMMRTYPQWSSILKIAGLLEYVHDIGKMYCVAHREKRIVHLQWIRFPLIDVVPAVLFKLLGGVIIMTVHDVYPAHKKNELNKFLYILYYKIIPNRLIVLSEFVMSEISNFLDVKNKSVVIPHGLLLESTPCVEREDARLSPLLVGLKESKIVLFWGNIDEYKGVDDLLAAYEKRKSDYKLVIAGRWRNQNDNIAKLYEQAKGSRDVTIINRYLQHNEIRDLLCGADVIILPYKYCSQSGVGFTALRYHIPIIVSNAGDLQDLIPDDIVKDFVVNINEPVQLSDAIDKFIKLDSLEVKRIRKEFKIHSKSFTWDAIAEQTINQYSIAIQKK